MILIVWMSFLKLCHNDATIHQMSLMTKNSNIPSGSTSILLAYLFPGMLKMSNSHVSNLIGLEVIRIPSISLSGYSSWSCTRGQVNDIHNHIDVDLYLATQFRNLLNDWILNIGAWTTGNVFCILWHLHLQSKARRYHSSRVV
jgi:hypothetical protein